MHRYVNKNSYFYHFPNFLISASLWPFFFQVYKGPTYLYRMLMKYFYCAIFILSSRSPFWPRKADLRVMHSTNSQISSQLEEEMIVVMLTTTTWCENYHLRSRTRSLPIRPRNLLVLDTQMGPIGIRGIPSVVPVSSVRIALTAVLVTTEH